MSEEIFRQQIKEEREKLEASLKEESKDVETKPEVVEDSSVTDEMTEAKDPVLEEAIKMGFNPNYEGPNKKTPEQFVRDGSFFRKIDSQNQKIDQLTDLVKNLNQHYSKSEKAAYENAYKQIMSERKQAVLEGDSEAFELADLKAQQLKEQINKDIPETTENKPKADEFTKAELEFAERNKGWFNKESEENIEMVNEAIMQDSMYKQLHPNMPELERLKKIEDKLRKLHPEKFENTKKDKPSMVSTSTVSTGKVKNTLASRMSDRQKDMARQAAKIDPSFNIEEYAKQLDSYGALQK